MDIEITIKDFMDSVDEEIARVAAGSYSEDGAPLYDGMKKTSRDEAVMQRLLSEAVAVVQNSMSRFIEEVDTDEDSINFAFSTTDRRTRGKEGMIENLLKSSLAKVLISKYFLEKQQTEPATKFDTLAAADLQMLQNAIYTKTAPSK